MNEADDVLLRCLGLRWEADEVADFPTGIFAKGVQRYMYIAAEKRKDKRLDVNRYEFLVDRQQRNALETGNVYVRDSNDFRSFEDDLISAERWKDRDAVLREIGANGGNTHGIPRRAGSQV